VLFYNRLFCEHLIEIPPYIGYKLLMSLQTVQTPIPEGFIDLGLGDPPLSLLPLDMIRVAAQVRLSQNDNSFLQYGAEQGDGHFRLALADFLSKGYGFPVDAQNLFVTNGISNALDLICSLFTKPGDTIFVEEPTYFLALRIFSDHDLRVVSIETDEDGIKPESLVNELAGSHPKFLYLIPTFQNPTGRTLTQERRERFMELSKEHGFIIVADEVYHFLSYTQAPPKPFAAYTDIENIIALGSFSKILAPGLRLGWLQAHSEKIKRFVGCGLLDSGGGLNPFTSTIVRGVIETGGLEKNIAALKEIYSSRVKVMDKALRQHLPQLTYTVPHGGYFFWVGLPDQMDASALREQAKSFKIDFRPGIKFSSRGGLRNYIRIGFAFYESEEIEEGVSRLKECLDSL
jgi:DNA-binding transcriptional MocR family regulator